MATEKVTAQLVIEADEQSFKIADWQVKQFARDTGKELDRNALFELRLNRAKLQRDLDLARGALRKAKKEGDELSILNAQIKVDKLQVWLTEAKRQLNNYQNTWDKALSRLQAKFNETNAVIKSQRSIVSWLNTVLGTLWVSLWTYFSTQKVAELSDSFTNLDNRLKQVAEWDSLETLRNKIFEAANSARADVGTYASAFARFDLINKQIGGSQEETLIIMDSLAKWLSATGAEASEVSAVMLQLSQAFGSWRLQWDEFRSVSENMPILLDILAKKLWVARGELKDMASEGLITSEVLKGALIDANEQLNESFEKSSVTIGQAMTIATNDFIKKFGEMDEVYWITLKITTAIWKAADALIYIIDVFFKYGWVIKEVTKLVAAFIWAKALLWLYKLLPWITTRMVAAWTATKAFWVSIWTATVWVKWFRKVLVALRVAMIAFAGSVAAALWPLWLIAAWLYAASKAWETYHEARENRRQAAENVENVNKMVEESKNRQVQEVKELQKRNKALEKENTDAAKKEIEINNAKLSKIEADLKAFNRFERANADGVSQEESQRLLKEYAEFKKTAQDKKELIDSLSGQDLSDLEDNIKEINEQIENLWWWEVDLSWVWWGGWSGESMADIELKKQEELQKKIKELQEKEKEREERLNNWKKDQIEDLKDAQESWTDTIEESMKESEENAKEYRKEIENIQSQIEKLNELEKDRAETLGERSIEIEKEINELKEERKDADFNERRAIREKINALIEEQQLIQANTTEAERQEAKRIDGLSKTEKFLEEMREKEQEVTWGKTREELENELAQTQEKLTQEEEIYNNFVKAKELIEEKYAEKVKSIEASITDTVQIESQKRIEALKQVEAQAIATAKALRNAQMGWSSVAPTTSSTTNNQTISPQIIVNAQVSNNVDIDSLWNQLANSVILSSKGIQ